MDPQVKRQMHERTALSNYMISLEMGITFRSSDLHGWSTLQPVRIIRDYCYMEPFDGDLYHLVIKAGCPTLANDLITRPNGDYATNDLMIEDPPGSNCWRTMGRCDDTLVMRNGEKTNPVPMEIALRRSPLIHRCTIIAQDRPCTAVLIELSSEEAKKYNANNYYNQGKTSNGRFVADGSYVKYQ